MSRSPFSTTDLNRLQRQLACWRQSQTQRTRLPEAVWAAAGTLAGTHGVSRVARTLGLDYHKLKRRVTPAGGRSLAIRPPPAFVELQLASALGGDAHSCRIELSAPAGGTMTLHLPCAAPAVLGLAEAFWRRAR
jgi:hypothetical protein